MVMHSLYDATVKVESEAYMQIAILAGLLVLFVEVCIDTPSNRAANAGLISGVETSQSQSG